MGYRFILLLLMISIPSWGMPAAGLAQTPNPLRTFQGVSFNNYQASQIPAESSPPVETAAGTGLPWEPVRDSERPEGVRVALNPLSLAAATEAVASSVPVMVAEPQPAAKNDLAPFHALLNSFQSERPASALPGEPDGMGSRERMAPGPIELQELGGAARFGQEESEASSTPPVSKFDKQRFQKLIRSLAFNTCIVMCVGVAFILLAKQWYKGKKPIERGMDTTIQIRSTLRLGHKSNLFLVEAGGHRLIVASDQNGIKSVVPLTESFSNTLDSFTDLADGGESPRDRDQDGTASGLYSLASVGEQEVEPKRDREPISRSARHPQQEAEDEIRRKMEKALGEQGLKDLFLQSLQSNR